MRTIIPFNDNWTFLKPGEDRVPVTLPHTWNNLDGQDGGGDYWRGECAYEKSFAAPDRKAGDAVYLEFDGASASARVTLNGQPVGEHHGGYSRFRFNITEYLQTGENRLTVAVSNAACDTVYPQNADFTFYGGIYRAVRLVVVPKCHFDMDTFGGCGVRVTPKVLEDGSAEVHVSARTTGGRAVFEIDGKALEGNEATFHIDRPVLWNGRKDPHLYTLKARLYDGDALCDSMEIPFGIRAFAIDPDEGFILNGESYPLRGVAMHQDWLGVGNAISEADMDASMEHVYDMGATTVRLAHYQHDQHTYDLCDRLGIVVWTEIPYISEHMDNARENALSQMRELIEQNYNHPSVVVWGLSNEITMARGDQETLVPFHRELNALCHGMDATRPTTMACISPLPVDHPLLDVPDVLSYNHYFGWYGGRMEENGPWFDRFHALHPDLAVGVSEYGCENSLWHASHPEPGDYSNEYQMRYHESLIKQLYTRKYLWATHVWNMFDFAADAREEGGTKGRNNKGLVTFDRKTRKDAFYAYQAWLTDAPMLHLCSKEFVNRDGDETEFVVYSNLPEVALTVNGAEYRQRAEDHFFHFTVKQPEGEYAVTASAGDLREEARFRHVAQPDPAYRFQQGTVLNWFEIDAPEGFYSIKDLLKDVILSHDAAELVKPLMAEMTAARAEKAKQKERETGRQTVKSGEGMSAADRLRTTLQFSLLQLIRMGAPDMPKARIIDLNKALNRIPRVKPPVDIDQAQYDKDMRRKGNACDVDDRFVLRDGQRHPFAVICPGGGYTMVCSYIEGVPYARKLNEMGISALIVYYRVGEAARFPAPQDDLAQALRDIFARADEYMLDTAHWSVWGSSAGGHLAASFGTANMGYPHYDLPKPEALVLTYPVISMRPDLTEQGTHDNLLGNPADESMEAFASVDEQVTADYPPTYIWCGDADQTVKPENTRRMAAALERAGVPYRCEIFPGVDHGVGPGTETAAEGWIDHAVEFWKTQQRSGT